MKLQSRLLCCLLVLVPVAAYGADAAVQLHDQGHALVKQGDTEAAHRHFVQAAELGHVESRFHVGEYLFHRLKIGMTGQNAETPKSKADLDARVRAAFPHVLAAAEAGHRPAIAKLGELYWSGFSARGADGQTSENLAKAEHYLAKAASVGDARAARLLPEVRAKIGKRTDDRRRRDAINNESEMACLARGVDPVDCALKQSQKP